MPVARAAAEPPLEPPAERVRSHGLRVAPNTSLTVFGPKANSGVLVLPITIAPAARSRSTTSASASGTWSAKSFEPCVVRSPRVGVTSLMPTATPRSGPGVAPRRSAVVARRASTSAVSRASVTIAFTRGLTASMRCRTACIVSRGEAFRAR
jgi:hypothetical protein